jgi:hypothetical protein
MLEETPLQYATLCGLYVPKAHTSKLFTVLTAQGIGHSIVGTSSSIVLTCVTPDMDFGAVGPEGMESASEKRIWFDRQQVKRLVQCLTRSHRFRGVRLRRAGETGKQQNR